MGAMRMPPWVLLIVAVAACSPLAGPESDRARATELLRQQRVIWDSLAIRDYDFTYAKSCSCPSATTSPVHIEVRGRNLQRVTDDIGTDMTAQTAMQWPTVDSLFVRTQAMIDNEGGTIEVVFDTLYHFPLLAQAFDSRTGALLRYSAGLLTPVTAPAVLSRSK